MGFPPNIVQIDWRTANWSFKYKDSVDRSKYTLRELSKGALRAIARLVRAEMLVWVREFRGMTKHRRPGNAYKYDDKIYEPSVKIGITHKTWYGLNQETGEKGMPQRKVLLISAYRKIPDMQQIALKYIGLMSYENPTIPYE